MPQSPHPGSLRLIAFSITGLAIGGAGVPLAIYLPAFYAQSMGLNLGLVGTIFMVSRLWNALSDPIVGVLPDRTRSRFGRRKPWIAVGFPLDAARHGLTGSWTGRSASLPFPARQASFCRRL